MWTVLIAIVLVCAVAFLVWASADISSNVYLKAFCRENTDEKVVYLTFDDGPSPETTGKVLDVLRERNAAATFFLIGRNIPGNEDIVRRIVAEGHSVGIHSDCHKNTFPLMSLRKMTADVLLCRTKLENVVGRPVTLFRPPFGVANPTIGKVVRQNGLKTVGWNVRSYDTVDYNKKGGHDRILARIGKRLSPGSVILLHDRLEGEDELLTVLLDLLDCEGYRYDRGLPLD